MTAQTLAGSQEVYESVHGIGLKCVRSCQIFLALLNKPDLKDDVVLFADSNEKMRDARQLFCSMLLSCYMPDADRISISSR